MRRSPSRRVVLARILVLSTLATLVASLGLSGASASPGDPVIAAAGDIACDPASPNYLTGSATLCHQRSTSDLLVGSGLSAVLALGDNQYECGSLQAYQQSYDLSWGRVKSITHPAVGNHEYLTSSASPSTGCTTANQGAAGYFGYFGTAAGPPGKGYYSYDIGTWHLVALNSNCADAGGCDPSSPQGRWLQADLAAHPTACTLAYWHIPLFSSGGRAANNSASFWTVLYDAGADVILTGHDHIYERFAPQTPTGLSDPARGVREFVVGTGGANHTSIATIFPNSEVRNTSAFGVLEMTLHPTSYDWRFVPEPHSPAFSDSGSASCHGSAAPPVRPPPPSPPGGQPPTGGPPAAVSVNPGPAPAQPSAAPSTVPQRVPAPRRICHPARSGRSGRYTRFVKRFCPPKSKLEVRFRSGYRSVAFVRVPQGGRVRYRIRVRGRTIRQGTLRA